MSLGRAPVAEIASRSFLMMMTDRLSSGAGYAATTREAAMAAFAKAGGGMIGEGRSLLCWRWLALLWQILSGTGFPNQFFCDSWVVGFWRGRPWLAGCRIGETSLNVGSCRF